MANKRQLIRQASFAGGEFSPRAVGRTDLPQYGSGLKSLKNWIVNPQGSATRRPGFKHIKTTKTLAPVSFTERVNPKNFGLNAVVWADGLALWVAVGVADGADPYIVTSPDGVTWTEQSSSEGNFGLNAITWTGSLLVAVGVADGTDAFILTSPNGTDWTERAPTVSKNLALNGITWTGSLLVAVGAADGTDAYIVTSTDGISWTEIAPTVSENIGLNGITWTGSLLVAVGDTASDSLVYILTSPDGIVWTRQDNVQSLNTILNDVTWTGSLLVAVGADSSEGYLITSPDGATWIDRIPGSPSKILNGITWTGSLLVAVGAADGSDAYIVTSTDGITWTERSNPKDFALNGIAWSGSLLVAVGAADGTDAYLITSPGDSALRRLEPFIGSTGSPYLMEFGQIYIRFLRDEVYVESGPGVPYEVATPWDAADIADVQLAQAHDVMYLTHPNYAPHKLTRNSEVAFSLVNLMDHSGPDININDSTYRLWDGPYLDENSTVTTLTISTGGTGANTLTASQDLFVSTDVGRVVRIFSAVDGSKVWGWGIITTFTSPTVVAFFVVEDPSTTSAETRWALGAWSGTTGYPRCVAFFQQRLTFQNTKHEPMREWATIIGSFQEFDPTQLNDTGDPDNAVYFTIASRRMLPIMWSESGLDQYVGTKGGIFRIDAGEGANEITPGSIRVRMISAYGADPALPALIGDILVYAQRGGRTLRALAAGAASDVLTHPDLTLLAEHMGESGIKQMEFASVPSSVLWMRRADGLLVAVTLNSVTKILAWHSHQLPGSLTGSDWPEVLSLAVLPLDGHDQLWIVVRRTIDGVEIETVEAMELPFDSTVVDQDQACYLDSSIYYEGVATSSITGLDHLEGESVYAYADGIVQGPFTVSGGAITLATAASKVWVGLAYDDLSDLETLPVKVLEITNAKVRVISTLVEVLDTNGLQIGIDSSNLSALNPSLQPTSWSSGSLKPLVTGDREHTLPGNSVTRPTVIIRPSGPLPATITGLAHTIEYDHI